MQAIEGIRRTFERLAALVLIRRRHHTKRAESEPCVMSVDREDEDDEPTCWICLTSDDGPHGHLARMPCKCPKHVHPPCLARWQLQRAGSDEECTCRFCSRTLPDWKAILTPANVSPSDTATMAVVLNGVEHRIVVEAGEAGRRAFERQIRDIYGLNSADEIEFTFDCVDPSPLTGGGHADYNIVLDGKRAYDAAFHCASVTAAMRSRAR